MLVLDIISIIKIKCGEFMKISLIMAVYNGEKYLIKQLQSINNQTNKIDEVILIDDCSKDRSVEIIEKFIKENQLDNWKLIINNENLGYKNNFKKDYH